MKKLLFPILSLFLLFTSCDKSVVYKDFRMTSNLEWNKSDVEVFEFTVEKDGKYALLFPFRYATGYSYSQIQINVNHTFDGESKDSKHSFQVIDDDGKYLGEGAGDIWDSEFVISPNIALSKGKHVITISHIMPKEKVNMVMETGLIVKDLSVK